MKKDKDKVKKAEAKVNDFGDWMKNKVKSIHWASNDQMSKAYEKVYNENLK